MTIHLPLAEQQTEAVHRLITNNGEGMLIYLFIKNYRDIWAQNGAAEAEKLFQTVAQGVINRLSTGTIIRYTDDGLLFHDDDLAQPEKQLSLLIEQLDRTTSTTIQQTIKPICYLSFTTFSSLSEPQFLISELFRSAYRAATDNLGNRISQPAATDKRSDEQKKQLQRLIHNQAFTLCYQAIASFQYDNKERYTLRLDVSDAEHEIDKLTEIAERHHLMHHIDQWQISHFLDELTHLDSSRLATFIFYIPLSESTLQSTQSLSWLQDKIQHSVCDNEQFVFQFNSENIGELSAEITLFCETLKAMGCQLAFSGLNNLQKDTEQLIDKIQPNALRFDMPEMMLLDRHEVDSFLQRLNLKATQLQAEVIADDLKSPAQLATIWHHKVKLIQGDEITPCRQTFDFDFKAFTL